MRALLSVFDKTGLLEFAKALHKQGVDLVASGGTGRVLRDAGLSVTTVEDLTGLPSVLGGRVKTLHPAIHGGILAREVDADELAEHGWQPIELVVVNLYPFVQTVAREGVTQAEAIEQIDIGGVALIRAAAKNFERVTIVTNPEDYDQVLAEITVEGSTSQGTRLALARKAFALTAAYDVAIADFLIGHQEGLPEALSLTLPQTMTLRYGENPHQAGALYGLPGVGPLGGEQLQGKALSYNNLLDIDAAWAAAEDFREPAVVIVKHLSPTGIAVGDDLPQVFQAALASDPVSAFGGVIACNRAVEAAMVEAFGDLFIEGVAAPDFSEEALALLAKRKNCRVLRMADLPAAGYGLRSVRGGVLAQSPDSDPPADWQVVTKREPTGEEMRAMRFAWQAVKHVKSNAIVFAKGEATVGIGGGLPSRVDAVRLAAAKAGENATGASMASDAFFPFPDGLEVAAEAGVTAVVQPGGSIRDEQVITAADRLGVAMCFTGVRHFRH
ncbi:MAG: bifunctional phosphoribosylaminoimidazolecarboxamide formyltransferase/IMP cyclohydrolase [Anaerolineae bacterium]